MNTIRCNIGWLLIAAGDSHRIFVKELPFPLWIKYNLMHVAKRFAL